jgi:hypothetical protein
VATINSAGWPHPFARAKAQNDLMRTTIKVLVVRNIDHLDILVHFVHFVPLDIQPISISMNGQRRHPAGLQLWKGAE